MISTQFGRCSQLGNNQTRHDNEPGSHTRTCTHSWGLYCRFQSYNAGVCVLSRSATLIDTKPLVQTTHVSSMYRIQKT